MTADLPSDEFLIRFKGDIVPFNSPIELLEKSFDRIPLTNNARERFEEILTELGSLTVRGNRWHHGSTTGSYLRSMDGSEGRVFYLALMGDAVPYNTISELVEALEGAETPQNDTPIA